MASNIRFKRSSVTGKSPTSIPQLPIGEIAINTRDGVVWMQEEGGRILNIRAGAALTSGKFIYVSPQGMIPIMMEVIPTNQENCKLALGIATAGDTVEVAAGTYVEQNPVVVPAGVSLNGEDLRGTVLVPQTVNQDFFHVNNGVHFSNFSFTGAATQVL